VCIVSIMSAELAAMLAMRAIYYIRSVCFKSSMMIEIYQIRCT
jgi:hypothetical protein